MPKLMEFPPNTPAERVTDILHGVPVTDPYRWLEDQESPRTREWLAGQVRYARSYLDSMPDRERIRERVRELLDVETYDSIQRVGDRYFLKAPAGAGTTWHLFSEGSDGERSAPR